MTVCANGNKEIVATRWHVVRLKQRFVWLNLSFIPINLCFILLKLCFVFAKQKDGSIKYIGKAIYPYA